MAWSVVTLICLALAALISPARIEPFLPARAERYKDLLIAGIQLWRLILIVTAAFSIFCAWYWRSRQPWAGPSADALRDHGPGSRDLPVVLGLALAALALRLPELNGSLWWDELNTLLRTVQRGVPVIFAFSADGNNHLLNSLGMYLTRSVFGEASWALRLPAFLLSLATPIAAYFLLKQIVPRGAAWTAFFVAVNFRYVSFAHEARGYAGAVIFALATSVVFVLMRQKPSRALAILYVISAACTVGFLATSLYLPVSYAAMAAAAMLWNRHCRRDLEAARRWLDLLLVCTWGVLASLLLVGIMIPQLVDYSLHRSDWAHESMSLRLLIDTFHYATGDEHLTVSFMAMALALVGWWRNRARPLLVAAMVGPSIFQVIAFWIGQSRSSPRIFAPAIFPICLGLSLFLVSELERRTKLLRTGLAAACVFIVVIDALPRYARFYQLGTPDLRALGHELTGKTVLLAGPQSDMNVYYFPQASWRETTVVDALKSISFQPEYLLEGYDCRQAPDWGASALGYQPVRRLVDWSASEPSVRHACFELFKNR